MNEVLKLRVRQFASRPAFQASWLSLLKLCHAGLNYGGGQMVRDSGEVEALEFASRAIQSPGPFLLFDVGANTGSYLEAALATLGDAVRAYAFEPQPFNVRLLQSQFGGDPRVTLKEVALGSESKIADLFFGVEGDPTASFHGSATTGETRTRSVQVATVDQVCREEALDRIDMLKIDTEGHEMDVLLGAGDMLRADKIASIQFEFGETFVQTHYHFRDLYDLLSPRYRIYRILRNGLCELPGYTHDLEIYKLSNFLCIHKSRSRLRQDG